MVSLIRFLFLTLLTCNLASAAYISIRGAQGEEYNSTGSFPELPFIGTEACVTGVWVLYELPNYENNAQDDLPEMVQANEMKCVQTPKGVKSARTFGNLSNIHQPSMTIFPDENFIGEENGPHFIGVPDFRDRINSIVFTGSSGGADMYTFYNYTGHRYCFDLGMGESVGMFMYNIAGGFYGDHWIKSFRFISEPCYSLTQENEANKLGKNSPAFILPTLN